jgi:hypothetical protein
MRRLRFVFLVGILCVAWFDVQAEQIRALNGDIYNGEISFSGTNRMTIHFSGDAKREFNLNQIASAMVNVASVNFSDYTALPMGWRSQSIGDVNLAGSAGVSNRTFAIRAAALDIGDRADTCAFISTEMAGDGELTGRVFNLDGADRFAKLGVMIRENADRASRFVMVSVNGNGEVCFQYRAENREKSVDGAILPARIPCWLKLVRRGKTFQAFYSRDGRDWNEAGAVTLKINDRASIGFALSSHSSFAMGSAMVDEARLTQHGLWGQYFNDEQFTEPKLARIDPGVDFNWGLGAPAEGLNRDHFSVRWTGQLEPEASGLHVFVWDADDSAALWLDDQSIPQTPFTGESSRNPPSVALVAGKRYDLRFEFREGAEMASVRLGWSAPGQNRQTLPKTSLFCTTEVQANSTGSNMSGAPLAAPGYAKGIYLRSGSFICGTVKAVSESLIRFTYRGHQEFSVLPHKVSRIVLRLPPRTGGSEPAAGRTGILLQNGDFSEGEIAAIANGQLNLSSVLFGLRKYSLADVCVIYTSSAPGSPARYSVQLRDGTVFRVDTLYPEGDDLILIEPILGPFRVAQSAIMEIRNGLDPERAGQEGR